MSRLDVVIFGATGFTGRHAALEMVRMSKKHGVTWGVAGRSHSKLESLMQHLAQKTGEDQSHVKIIIADVSDDKSLKDMCLQAKVIANCCGPYRLYGEPVVRAAIEAKTHHVDVTGEPQFIETMQLKYSEEAREAGVYVISACGYDSIPSDLGTVFLQQHFGGTVNSVESYMSSSLPPQYWMETLRRGAVHYGTWASLVHGLAHYDELKPLKQKLYPEKLPAFEPKLEKRGVLHRRGGGWCLPFPGADNSIVYRTQRTLHATEGVRPAQFRCYVKFSTLIQAVAILLWAGAVYGMTRMCSFTRNLLLEYPRFFTFGVVSHAGPAEEAMRHTSYDVTLHGAGWSHGDVTAVPDRRAVAKVSGMNPGYGATVCALLCSALTVLEESDKMPGKGGVLTTGYAFRNTNIIKHLSENNMKFEIVEVEDIQ